MIFSPVRHALGDGFRCIRRYKRIWITFALLGFGYFLFQFVTFTPIRNWADLDLNQIISLPRWYWPRFVDIWRETPLPALEGVAGIFDNATTTYPLSVVAAVFMLANWRGLHGALLRALWKRYRFWGHLTYLILVLSALASLSETNCVLATTRVEWISLGCGTASNLGHSRCDRVHFRISPGRLHSGVSHHRLPGLDKGREL